MGMIKAVVVDHHHRMYLPRKMFSSHLHMDLMVGGCISLLERLLMCFDTILVDTDYQTGYWQAVGGFLDSLDTA